MAIRHVATNLCELLIQSATGSVSLINIYYNIQVRAFPSIKDPFCAFVQFVADPGDPYRITIEGPDDFEVEIGAGAMENHVPDHPHQQWGGGAIYVASPAFFPREGVYSVVLRERERVVNSHPFGVYLAVPPEHNNG